MSVAGDLTASVYTHVDTLPPHYTILHVHVPPHTSALEDDDEQASLWMNNAEGEGVEQESETEKQQIDDSDKDPVL